MPLVHRARTAAAWTFSSPSANKPAFVVTRMTSTSSSDSVKARRLREAIFRPPGIRGSSDAEDARSRGRVRCPFGKSILETRWVGGQRGGRNMEMEWWMERAPCQPAYRICWPWPSVVASELIIARSLLGAVIGTIGAMGGKSGRPEQCGPRQGGDGWRGQFGPWQGTAEAAASRFSESECWTRNELGSA